MSVRQRTRRGVHPVGTELEGAGIDPEKFAANVLGQPLFGYQAEVARSGATVRVMRAGRQVGKSFLLAALALFEATTRRGVTVLFISAGEEAAKRLLGECSRLVAASAGLDGSIVEETKTTLRFSTGSRIMSVPASEKQIRGISADLLVIDEASFVPEEIWVSAQPTTIARPGARIILASTPYLSDHFFKHLWDQGMRSPDAYVRSWHWPSITSPLVTEETLEGVRRGINPVRFKREYEAQWPEGSGLLLTPDELENSVLDYEMVEPERAYQEHGFAPVGRGGLLASPQVTGGLDYGSQVDANALVLIGALEDYGANFDMEDLRRGRTSADHIFFIPWLEYHHRMNYDVFADRVVEVAKGYNIRSLASETNGAGAGAHRFMELAMARALERREIASVVNGTRRFGTWGTAVVPVWTDNRRKQVQFGTLKGMLQSGTLVLPRHGELLKQLASLEMTETASGSISISVPERVGHDDLAMALAQALMNIATPSMHNQQRFGPQPRGVEFAELGTGRRVPSRPRLLDPENLFVFNGGSLGAESEQPL